MPTNYLAGLINPLDAISAGRKYVQEGDDYSRKLLEYATQQQAGQQYASGNRSGAAQTLASGGNIAGAQQIEQGEAARLKAQHDYLRQASPLLEAALTKDGPQGLARAWQMVSPELRQAGTTDQEIAQIGQRLQSDPQGALAYIKTIAGTDLQFTANGGVYDKNANQWLVQPEKYMTVPAGADIAKIGLGGTATNVPVTNQPPQTSGAAASSPAPAGGMAAPVATPTPQPSAPAPSPTNRPMPVAPTNQHAPLPAPGPSDAYLAQPRPEGNMAAGTLTPELAPSAQTASPNVQIVASGRPKPSFRPATAEDKARYPGMDGFSADGTPHYPPASATGSPIDSKTLDYLAQRYLAGDVTAVQQLGRSGTNKLAVIRRAQEMSAALQGTPAGDAAQAALRAANSAALRQNTTMGANVAQAEKTALRNADLVLSLAPRGVGPTKTPIIDSWIQAGRRGTGDPDVAAYNVAVRTFANEYARVMSGGTGSQQLSDASRREIDDLLSNDQTLEQVRSSIAVMKQDMENRQAGIHEEHDALVDALSMSPGSQQTSQTSQPAQAGDVRPGPNGTRWRFKGGNVRDRNNWEAVQ